MRVTDTSTATADIQGTKIGIDLRLLFRTLCECESYTAGGSSFVVRKFRADEMIRASS